MKKIDKTLKEVRSWKRKVAAKVRRMTRAERVAYYNAAKGFLPSTRKHKAA